MEFYIPYYEMNKLLICKNDFKYQKLIFRYINIYLNIHKSFLDIINNVFVFYIKNSFLLSKNGF